MRTHKTDNEPRVYFSNIISNRNRAIDHFCLYIVSVAADISHMYNIEIVNALEKYYFVTIICHLRGHMDRVGSGIRKSIY